MQSEILRIQNCHEDKGAMVGYDGYDSSLLADLMPICFGSHDQAARCGMTGRRETGPQGIYEKSADDMTIDYTRFNVNKKKSGFPRRTETVC